MALWVEDVAGVIELDVVFDGNELLVEPVDLVGVCALSIKSDPSCSVKKKVRSSQKKWFSVMKSQEKACFFCDFSLTFHD